MRCWLSASLPILVLSVAGCGADDGAPPADVDGATVDAGPFACPGAADPAPRLTLAPVVPVGPGEASTFEGFAVRSRIPADPRGLVYLFHGTGGGVGFASQLGTVEVTNALEALGYGWIATESTERTGDRRWDAALTATNPDLARLGRLQADLQARGVVDATTPLFALGMSNGAVFTGTFAHWARRDAGLPLRAAAMFEGKWREDVFADAAPLMPTLHVRAANDTIADVPTMVTQTAAAAAAGRPVIAHEAAEVPLVAARLQRVPGIDAADADAIMAELVRRGVIDAGGRRLIATTEAGSRLAGFAVAGVTPAQLADALDEVKGAWAEHVMRGDYTPQVVALFTCAR